jgi:hypothetical protein
MVTNLQLYLAINTAILANAVTVLAGVAYLEWQSHKRDSKRNERRR